MGGMWMNMKHTCCAAVIFCALIGAQLLASCGDSMTDDGTVTTDVQTTTPETETTYDPDADGLGALDLGGETVTVYTREHERFDDEISVDALTGDIVNDAIFDRETRVEERLNVAIETVKEGGQHGSFDKMKQLVLAGDKTYDIFSASMFTTTPGASTGIFRDLNDFDAIDLTKPYYTQDYIRQTTINGKKFTLTGDLSLSLTRYSFCMYFNKNLLAAYDLGNPYDLVRSGKWTHETMREMVTGIYSDLNTDNKADDADLYGLGTSNVIIIDAYTSAYDLKMVEFDDGGMPMLCIDMEKYSDAVKRLYSLNYETEGVHFYKEISDNNEMTDLCNYFSQDHLVFINNWIYGLETEYLRSMPSDFGVLPYPKYDEQQESYYTFQHDQIGVFAIPITSEKAECAAAVLEAMSSDSRKYLVPTFYDNALKDKYSRDADTAEMIDIIHNNHKLDPAWLFSSYVYGLGQAPRDLLLRKSSDFASFYARQEKTFQKNLEKLFEDFNKIES